MKRKTRILCLTTHYLPGYKFGGPIRTIDNMVEQLSDDLEFRVVTSDRDALDTQPYPDIRRDAWNPVGRAQVLYLDRGRRTLSTFARLLRETDHDVLYLNSFFDPLFTLQPLLARRWPGVPKRPCVLAPRGEFSAGAMALKSRKKKVYVAATRAMGLYDGITWQASADEEVDDIRRVIGRSAITIKVAPDMPPRQTADMQPARARVQGEPVKVCFLSRIHPKKNLLFALDVVRHATVPVDLNIYGPIYDPAYWSECLAQMATLSPSVRAVYRGAVAPDQVLAVMAEHDLFFLPTLGENYGHVIAEAMKAGTPVLIADTTPWRGLEEKGVGWDLPLSDREGFVGKLAAVAGLDADAYAAFRRRARAYVLGLLTDPEVFDSNRRLFAAAS